MSEYLLNVKNLSVRFRGQPSAAVSNVSFKLRPASVFGIIGESGAGKSSLAMALLGLHDSREVKIGGEVTFQGKNLLDYSEGDLCKVRGSGIGMIFQDSMGALDPSMKVVDQLAEVIRMRESASRGESRLLAIQHLERVGIAGDILAAAPHAYQLSGGLCQRAMIAMALACNPEVLIADEPTSSLDLRLQAQIIALLNERRRSTGLSIVFISHDLGLVSRFADDIMVLHEGATVESGKCADILNKPSHAYTKSLVGVWGQSGQKGEKAVAPA
ncbi:MAG: ABC transporter ATP-binding protein [Thermoleophilia bacterium]|nr:ABC transporter ATP-binding protein [Thermoleophilia bacterium]